MLQVSVGPNSLVWNCVLGCRAPGGGRGGGRKLRGCGIGLWDMGWEFWGGKYEGPPHKIPHKIDLVLVRGGGHVCLVQILRHGGVVRQFVEEGAQRYC